MQHTWVYQLKSALTEAQKSAISNGLTELVQDWKAHGTPVPGRFEIRHDRFVIVQAEPGSTSGCSIDSMTRGVTELLHSQGCELMERNFVFFREADGDIAFIDFREAPAAIASGRLTADTIVFDASLNGGTELSAWEVPLSQTWLARHLPKAEKA